ncbi:hypothetical protein BVRB_5g101840 [Beta vulgaris subsp. vulgaris]|nr:hypothetical protein BVRB_5g101840 [Beta vulgaris subsp. vulgaris]
MNDELEALKSNLRNHYGKHAIGCKWLYRTKYNPDGSVERHKSRLVILENRQRFGVDYGETFAPIFKLVTVRQSISEYDTFSPIVGFAYEMEEHGDRKTSKDDEENVYMDDKEGDDDDDGDGKCKYDNYYVVYSDDDEDDEYYYDGSDGYDEDDDDNGSDDEIGWSDDDDEEEEYDSDLETRIEAFIAKVINGWKEEWLSDNLKN